MRAARRAAQGQKFLVHGPRQTAAGAQAAPARNERLPPVGTPRLWVRNPGRQCLTASTKQGPLAERNDGSWLKVQLEGPAVKDGTGVVMGYALDMRAGTEDDPHDVYVTCSESTAVSAHALLARPRAARGARARLA